MERTIGRLSLRQQLVVSDCIACAIKFAFHVILYFSCMHADVMVCVCQIQIKKLLTYLLTYLHKDWH